MFRHLTSRLTATLAAAGLALGTVLPAPAAAMDDKDRRLLTLLLGAAAVGVIINEANKNKKRPAPQVAHRYDDEGNIYYGDDHDWRRDKHRWRHRTIPAECVFVLRGARGPRDVVSARCLSELGPRRELPAECAFEVDAGWGSRKVYGTRCLRENGYRIAEAH